jgi:hypothetical protein
MEREGGIGKQDQQSDQVKPQGEQKGQKTPEKADVETDFLERIFDDEEKAYKEWAQLLTPERYVETPRIHELLELLSDEEIYKEWAQLPTPKRYVVRTALYRFFLDLHEIEYALGPETPQGVPMGIKFYRGRRVPHFSDPDKWWEHGYRLEKERKMYELAHKREKRRGKLLIDMITSSGGLNDPNAQPFPYSRLEWGRPPRKKPSRPDPSAP